MLCVRRIQGRPRRRHELTQPLVALRIEALHLVTSVRGEGDPVINRHILPVVELINFSVRLQLLNHVEKIVDRRLDVGVLAFMRNTVKAIVEVALRHVGPAEHVCHRRNSLRIRGQRIFDEPRERIHHQRRRRVGRVLLSNTGLPALFVHEYAAVTHQSIVDAFGSHTYRIGRSKVLIMSEDVPEQRTSRTQRITLHAGAH